MVSHHKNHHARQMRPMVCTNFIEPGTCEKIAESTQKKLRSQGLKYFNPTFVIFFKYRWLVVEPYPKK